MISPAAEELLERLYVHEVEEGPYPDDLAVPAVVEAAEAAGLIRRDGDSGGDPAAGGTCVLTPSGRQAGEDVVRRHRLAECLLRDVLDVRDDRQAEDDACRFEHILQRGLEEKVCSLLGHPRTCPHGKPIPPGACCRGAGEDSIPEVGPLCDAQAGQMGTVAYLATREDREIQKMMAMGILPGADIRLLRRFPSFVFQVGYSQFTVDRELAASVYVHWKRIGEDGADAPTQPGPPRGRGRRRRFGWRRG